MRGQPIAAETKQLLDLLIADPVVFLAIEHRNENVHVCQRPLHGGGRGQPDRPLDAASAVRRYVDGERLYRVAEWTEKPHRQFVVVAECDR
jgi:hypothetical protein